MKQWLKNNLKVIFIIGIGVFILLLCFLLLLPLCFPSYACNLPSILISFFTLVAISLYVERTHRQVEEAHRQVEEIRSQREALLRPYLRLQWFNPEKDGEDGILQIVNIGKGPAINVEFKECTSDEAKFQIKKIPAISAGGHTTINRKQIEIKPPLPRDADDEHIKSHLRSMSNTHYRIEATYENLEKRKFKVIFEADDEYNDGFRIVSQDKQ